MNDRAVRLLVSGRVQGVGFRWFVRERARRLGLAGRVRNLADGAVEIVARGAESDVALLLEVVRRGPEGARVDDVAELPLPEPPSLPRPFEIER